MAICYFALDVLLEMMWTGLLGFWIMFKKM